MVRGRNGRRHRYALRIRRRRRGLQRGGVLPMLAMALSPWAVKKRQRRMKRSFVNGVEITCKRIIMANCMAGVGRFLP